MRVRAWADGCWRAQRGAGRWGARGLQRGKAVAGDEARELSGVKRCSPVRAGGSPAHWMCEQVGRSAHNTRTSSERSWAPSASLVTMARTWLTHCSRRGPHDFLTLVHGRRTSSSVRRALAASIGGVMGPSEGAERGARVQFFLSVFALNVGGLRAR